MDLNVRGVFNLTQKCAKLLEAAGVYIIVAIACHCVPSLRNIVWAHSIWVAMAVQVCTVIQPEWYENETHAAAKSV